MATAREDLAAASWRLRPMAQADIAREIDLIAATDPATLGARLWGQFALHHRAGDEHVLLRDPMGVYKLFFAIDADGEVSYLNATLSSWLDFDLARFGSGGLHLDDICTPAAAALIQAIRGQPGDVRVEVLDVDLKRRNGSPLPVRLHHQVAFGQDGRAGPSRTLVLNRAAGEAGADSGSDAEVRFARFFHSTPMAIATVDKAGAILRSNAAFARLVPAGVQATTIHDLVAPGSGLDKAVETALVNASPAWLTDLTTRF